MSRRRADGVRSPGRGHRIATWVALVAVVTASCSPGDRATVYPVKGTVLYKGKPIEGAMVVLHKPDDPQARAIKPFGKTDANGVFQVSYYTANDGCPDGEYVGTVVWPTPPRPDDPDQQLGADRLKGRFADPKASKWKVTVGKQPTELPPIALD